MRRAIVPVTVIGRGTLSLFACSLLRNDADHVCFRIGRLPLLNCHLRLWLGDRCAFFLSPCHGGPGNDASKGASGLCTKKQRAARRRDGVFGGRSIEAKDGGEIDNVVRASQPHDVGGTAAEDDAPAVGDAEDVSRGRDDVSAGLEQILLCMLVGRGRRDSRRIAYLKNGTIAQGSADGGSLEKKRKAG